MAATSPSATSRPVSPSTTPSGMPLCRVATTGSALAIASAIATGKPSVSPFDAVTECCAKTAARRISAPQAAWSSAPCSVTRAPMPVSATAASTSGRSGPSPTRSSRASGCAAAACAKARTVRCGAFFSTSRPMASTRPGSGAPGGKRAGSTPQGITSISPAGQPASATSRSARKRETAITRAARGQSRR